VPLNLDFPQVDVLLATYNGGKFLSEQLDSILCQEFVTVRIVVSDDCSTDTTLKILESYRRNHPNIELVTGPGQGPSANFFSLLEYAKANYIALSDQDDIWEPNHLIESVNALRASEGVSAMTFSNIRVLTNFKYRYTHVKVDWLPQPKNRFFENLAHGCTIVMNKKLVDSIRGRYPKNAIMHDFWIYLVASSIGRVILIKNVTVNYRLHGSNVIGISRKISMRRIQNLAQHSWPVYHQLSELNQLYKTEIHSEVLLELSRLISNLKKSRLHRFLRLSLRLTRYRKSLVDEVFLRLALSIVRIKN
jgi:glycosyltransferase involved in cell wall biosynthesis